MTRYASEQEFAEEQLVLSECLIPELGEAKVGKVREIYFAGENVVMVTNDRVSAFDFILPNLIPFKGQVLNGISEAQAAKRDTELCQAPAELRQRLPQQAFKSFAELAAVGAEGFGVELWGHRAR